MIAESRFPAPRFRGDHAPAKPRWMAIQRAFAAVRQPDLRAEASDRASKGEPDMLAATAAVMA